MIFNSLTGEKRIAKSATFNSDLFFERLKKISGNAKQKEICEKIKERTGIIIAEKTISEWKNKGITPTLDNLLAICDTYKCSMDYLLGTDACRYTLLIDNLRPFILNNNHTKYTWEYDGSNKEIVLKIQGFESQFIIELFEKINNSNLSASEIETEYYNTYRKICAYFNYLENDPDFLS